MGDSGVLLKLTWGVWGIPLPVPEFVFHPQRKWRFDWAWPEQTVGVEVEGGIWTRGRHTRGKGYEQDMEKYNAAVLLGWKVLRFTPQELKSGKAQGYVKKVLEFYGQVYCKP